MSYQVIARKWRPQKFADVIGQQAVTRTLGNALASGRLAQAFVFAGPRGVGKTTTARILARALSCSEGPTAEPCGVCDACVEISEGRDIDVLEIDAATHTGVDNIREVIISGLSIRPVRNRYKIFIIDEVHQLSTPSFNALLKSIEEPPPHVVFMMATTELDKIPETVLSRSQVYEFRIISARSIADQLRRIVDAEGIAVGDESLQLIARDAEGSMRDAQSKLDQVLAFTGNTISGEDVATVLGLVGRDLLLDVVQAVADEHASAAFDLAGRAVEMGYDLRAVCRELSRVVRDLLLLTVDPSRLSDPEIAGEGERERLKTLATRFSREDLLRAFDLLTRAELEIRGAAQPRYHLEVALLRWIHLRKLVPIEDLIASGGSGSARVGVGQGSGPLPPSPSKMTTSPQLGAAASSGSLRVGAAQASRLPQTPIERPAASPVQATPLRSVPTAVAAQSAPTPAVPPAAAASASVVSSDVGAARVPSSSTPLGQRDGTGAVATDQLNFKDALLTEIRRAKAVFYNMVVAQAQKIEIADDRVTFSFSTNQRTLRDTFEQNRAWLEGVAQQVAGRRITVACQRAEVAPAASPSAPPTAVAGTPHVSGSTGDAGDTIKKSALRERALADAGVQALLEVFPAEIRDVEEM